MATDRSGERPDAAVYYWDYLQLDKVLSSQERESERAGDPAHDEMLFIVVHQAFELWFKQILFELDAVLGLFGAETVPERNVGRAVDHLRRIVAIQPLLVEHIDVLETMTPLDFLEFRDHLVPASGFQSVQFRLIENRLGLDPRYRLRIKGQPYTSVLAESHVALLRRSETEPSLHDLVDQWLARTPFLRDEQFDFWQEYRAAVERRLAADRARVERASDTDEETRAANLAAVDESAQTFATLFDAERYEELLERGQRRLSQDAFLAALLISLYRDEPMLQAPFALLRTLVDLDEGFTAWRQRHALLAHRMIGDRIGTGGTSGHEYLQAAARRHRVFSDLFDLPTFLLPRSELPPLPEGLARQLDFRYGG